MTLSREETDNLGEIFFPHGTQREKSFLEPGGRLVHYTTAENALKIIKSKTLWLRNARCMHDFSEVEYGFSRLQRYLQNEKHYRRFSSALDGCAENLANEAIGLFDQWWGKIRGGTYISCLSEHDPTEDDHGRLSMWRAFGQSVAGVALVLRWPGPYSAQALHVNLSPVGYFSDQVLWDEIDKVISNIESHRERLRDVPRAELVGYVYSLLMMAVVSLKHPGFEEEREWRLIYTPDQLRSPTLESETVTVGGIPQIVHKLKFENNPGLGVTGIDFSELIDRIIIGPSQYAFTMKESLAKELEKIGIEHPESKIFISGIPIRG